MPTLPEPDWNTSTPTKSWTEQSSLCLIRPSPSIVTGILLQLIRAHFSDPDNIEDPDLKVYVWKDDDTEGHTIESKVQIEPTYKFKVETLQQRPSILVCRETLKNTEFAINNGPGPSVSPISGNYEGDKKYTLLHGRHSIEVCSNRPMEADRLSEEVFFRMLEYKQVIKNDLNFSEFDVTLLKELQKVDENEEHWKAVIEIEWKFVYVWRLAPVAPVLKSIGQIFNLT